MKFFSLVLPVFAVFTAVSAAPAPADSVMKRDSDPTSIITSLFTSVQQQTAKINSTASGVSTSSPADQQQAAGETISDAIAAINAAVVDATSQINALHSKRSILAVRQSNSDLAGLVTGLLLEISGTLNNVISSLGLTATLSFLGPLVSSLSSLLLALEHVVNQLLALVKELLDDVLTGLSAALSGLEL